MLLTDCQLREQFRYQLIVNFGKLLEINEQQ